MQNKVSQNKEIKHAFAPDSAEGSGSGNEKIYTYQ
jgi:hypothetical protein